MVALGCMHCSCRSSPHQGSRAKGSPMRLACCSCEPAAEPAGTQSQAAALQSPQPCRPPAAAASEKHHVGRRLAMRAALRVDLVRLQHLADLGGQLVDHCSGVGRLRGARSGRMQLMALLKLRTCTATHAAAPSLSRHHKAPHQRPPAPGSTCSEACSARQIMQHVKQQLRSLRRPLTSGLSSPGRHSSSGRLSFRGSVPVTASVRPAPRSTTPQRCSVA
jgi:hypothetical protein